MSEFDTNLDAQTVDTKEETDKKCPVKLDRTFLYLIKK